MGYDWELDPEGRLDAVDKIINDGGPDLTDIDRFIVRIDSAGESMTDSVMTEIADMRSAGFDDATIQDVMLDRFNEGTFDAGGFKDIERELDKSIETIQQRYYSDAREQVFLDEIGEAEVKEHGLDNAKFVWYAIGSNSCKDCIKRHGKVLPYAEWKRKGLPGTGSTACRKNCQCTLMPVKQAAEMFGTSPDGLEKAFQADVQEREKEIRKREKERGKPYAESTFNALVGQWRQ